MRVTIERLRTLVLATGALLILALAGFLTLGHWKNRLNLKELPKRLGADIQSDSSGYTLTMSRHGRTAGKLHAARVVQLKKDGHAQLEDVQIELYAQDGSTLDRIRGGEFEYDQKAGLATAAGPVEITIVRPAETLNAAPGVRGKAQAKPKQSSTLANAAQTAERGQIEVKTSGLTFDQKSGVASTLQHVEFALVQGSGSSTGAEFDSDKGRLVLDRDVELDVRRGTGIVRLHANHGEFDRNQLVCDLQGAAAKYRNAEAQATQAQVHFRQDGSATRMDAQDGFTLSNSGGTKIAAPSGSISFNDRNQPIEGRLGGGVTMQSDRGGSRATGSAPEALLAFGPNGVLRRAHLERGVTMHSEQDRSGGQVVRDWRSPVADVAFRSGAKGQLEMASVQGTGGVTVTARSQRRGEAAVPMRMSADQMNGEFGPGQELTRILGVGHASVEQTNASGVRQVTSGDRLDAKFAPAGEHAETSPAVSTSARPAGQDAAQQIQSATIDGNVVLMEQQPAKAGEPQPPPLRANAAHALYEGGWMHLSGGPRVDDGTFRLTADKLDISQPTGDTFAHGNVKATWLDEGTTGRGATSAPGGLALGGQGPAHIVAEEAQMHRSSDQATFLGQARLWQGSNSVSAPEIVLDKTRQTLAARATGAGQAVHLVLLSAGRAQQASDEKSTGAGQAPSVISVRAEDLKYSSAERKAFLKGGKSDPVQAETASATTSSREAEVDLLPPGNHAGANGGAAQVDKLTARGHVVIVSQGRRGTGEQLVYQGTTGSYVLTGTPQAPPRMTDAVRGSVTGDALIFNSRDDSVSIEGQGQKTLTQTVAPK